MHRSQRSRPQSRPCRLCGCGALENYNILREKNLHSRRVNILGLFGYIVILWVYDYRYKFTDAGGQAPDFGYAQYTAAAFSQVIINGQKKNLNFPGE